ncbi:MAG: outer membrane beta-barrel protein [Bacteroidetes bacterium]|nr:outer membrane beta-barrel protein [Bacteroidota bacterium]
MNKIKYIFLTLLILSAFTTDSFSQTRRGGYIASLDYSMTFNVGRSSDYLSNPGLWGGAMEIKSFTKNNIAVGVLIGLNVVSKQEENGSTELKNGLITGPQARYLNYSPVMASVGYYFNKGYRNKTIPYIQANVGAYYIWQRLQVGANIIDNDNWHFGAAPQVGVIFNLGKNVGFNISGRYNYAFSAGEPLGNADNNSYSFISANIGFSYLK